MFKSHIDDFFKKSLKRDFLKMGKKSTIRENLNV